ncbi:MAG: hypothetical protein JO366_21185 [Methylobacteriaceae bacterium]|nr:hypothetical protein [Methylobacteriaceae bacterium]
MTRPFEPKGAQPEALSTFKKAAQNDGIKPPDQGLTATSETAQRPDDLADQEKAAAEILGGNTVGDRKKVDDAILRRAKSDKRDV